MRVKARQGQAQGASQRDRFVQTARKLGADENEAAFKEKLAVIARQKPKDDTAGAPSSQKRTAKAKR